MARHTTARGDPIDIGALISQNADAPALGNARMNARGDILGDKGIVLKTQEQIEAEWEAEKAKQKLLAGRPGNIKGSLETMVDPSKAPQQKNLTADKDFEPELTDTVPAPVSNNAQYEKAQPAPRRRITEAD